MLISIDYDETYTLDEDFWSSFISLAIGKGHEVICCTMRHSTHEESMEVIESIGKFCPVYFSGRKAKRDYLRRLGILPDVWIDDVPEWIYKDAIV